MGTSALGSSKSSDRRESGPESASPCVRVVLPLRRGGDDRNINNFSRQPEGGVNRFARHPIFFIAQNGNTTLCAQLLRASNGLTTPLRSAPALGNRSCSDTRTAFDSGQATEPLQVLRPDPRVSMAPNFKLKIPSELQQTDSGNILVSSHLQLRQQISLLPPILNYWSPSTTPPSGCALRYFSIHKPANPHAIHQPKHQER